ncbi:TIGR04222 domain-containing membrane protein [Streptomyces tsukubensis]|uniref:TIGR04222 domain-containing membrane protein n=1 Tax=Streptomyces tsukubensis TaxID=83656 RepID=A0A1V4A9W6_9ACTN|nr:TIGR04222 domain-containing membrane protein [Streptomyces tsukubensis]OON80597.1 hypothetical protein B1H18_11970 [Streptomyces tsukubensis]QFR96250.1 TIGR04222 domain-containing membrane protein [Streptomyces tsukubensis]
MLWIPLLLVACASTGLACARLCLAAIRAGETAPSVEVSEADARILAAYELPLHEAAYLSGGPLRAVDVTLVAMARGRRLLLARTGWATVVDPRGRNDLERAVLLALGVRGQELIAVVRAAVATSDAVRALAERLNTAGLAVPDRARENVASATRQVAWTALALPALTALALLSPSAAPGTPGTEIVAWFSLPAVLALGCLVVARIEVHPYTRWASPVGQRLLGAFVARERTGEGGAALVAVAVRGVRALRDPALSAAFARRRPPQRAQ